MQTTWIYELRYTQLKLIALYIKHEEFIYMQLQFHFAILVLVLEVDQLCLITFSALELKAVSLNAAVAVLK